MRNVNSGKNILEIQEEVQKGLMHLKDGVQEIVYSVEKSPAYIGSPSTFEDVLIKLLKSSSLDDFNLTMDILFDRLIMHFTGSSSSIKTA